MRVMYTVWPATAHLLPIVSQAWALQLAGHEVCIACPPGIADAISATGLTAVECGEPEALAIHNSAESVGQASDADSELLPSVEELDRLAEILRIDPAERDCWDMFYQFNMVGIRDYHPPQPRRDIDALIAFARDWQPDLVLWDPFFPCGAVAARACGAAHARALMTFDNTGWATERYAEHNGRVGAYPLDNPLAETMRPLAQRYGFDVDAELLLGQWTLDPLPAAMQLRTTTVKKVPVRWVPFTGGEVKPDWLYKKPERPRVAISLGVSTRMYYKADWGRTAKLLEAVADLDIDVIATLNADQLLDLRGGQVPHNVRTVDYVPLSQLLPTCSAVIHHGSMGTFMAASSLRLPQLVCDTDEPIRLTAVETESGIEWRGSEKHFCAPRTSKYVVEMGAGVRLNHQTQTVDEIRKLIHQVLTEPKYQDGANAVYQDWASRPSPTNVIPLLEKLTAEHRSR